MLIMIISLLLTLSCFAIETRQLFLAPHHVLETNNEFEVLWNRSDIFMNDSDRRPGMVGAPGRIIIHGWKSGEITAHTIIGLDSISGNITWTIPGGGEIITEGENLYLGTAGTAIVKSYNIENGELLWDTLLPWAHSVVGLHVAENKIFAHTGDDEFFTLNEEGEILDTFHQNFRTFLVINDVLYMKGNFSIKAVDFSSKKELWGLRLDDDFSHAPIFDDGAIFLRTWLRTPTYIYSIDQFTGKVNWKLSQDLLSN